MTGSRSRLAVACAGAALLAACQTTPEPGRLQRVEVLSLPRTRAEIPSNPQVPEALEAFESEIRARRLMAAQCLGAEASAPRGGSRLVRAWVRLPAAGAARDGQVVLTRASPGASRALVLDLVAVPPEAAEPAAPDCAIGADGAPTRVRLQAPVPVFELEFSRAERARHRRATDAALAAGRVGLGRCALKALTGEVVYQPAWLFLIPEGLAAAPGDVVLLRLGEAEGGGGSGRVSVMQAWLGRGDAAPGPRAAAIDCG